LLFRFSYLAFRLVEGPSAGHSYEAFNFGSRRVSARNCRRANPGPIFEAALAFLRLLHELAFLVAFLAIGGITAAVAFAFGAFELPLLFDRDIGFAEAASIRLAAVIGNPEAMTFWAAILVVLVSAGVRFAYVGRAVTPPTAGCASRRAYRAAILPARLDWRQGAVGFPRPEPGMRHISRLASMALRAIP
jgi:hypothetical protein